MVILEDFFMKNLIANLDIWEPSFHMLNNLQNLVSSAAYNHDGVVLSIIPHSLHRNIDAVKGLSTQDLHH